MIATASLSLFQRHDFSVASQFAPASAQLRAFAQRYAPAGRDAEPSALALMRAIGATCA